MTQTFDLNKMGVIPMDRLEMQETDGGGLPGWATWLGEQIISNWDDIKKGAKEGWNSVHYN